MQEDTFCGHINLNHGIDARKRISFNGKFLELFLNEVNHSPDGFEWGYAGSGPAQSAYAILRTTINHRFPRMPVRYCVLIARVMHQKFKRDMIMPLDINCEFELSLEDVITWISNNVTSIGSEYSHLAYLFEKARET